MSWIWPAGQTLPTPGLGYQLAQGCLHDETESYESDTEIALGPSAAPAVTAVQICYTCMINLKLQQFFCFSRNSLHSLHALFCPLGHGVNDCICMQQSPSEPRNIHQELHQSHLAEKARLVRVWYTLDTKYLFLHQRLLILKLFFHV